MSQTNSQPFEVEGNTYSTTVVNGEISVISQQDSNGLYTPIDPSTDLFDDLSLNQASITAIEVNTNQTGLSEDDVVWQDEALLTKNYNESLKNYNNALRIENPDNAEGFAKRETKNANPVISVETLRYPYDIDIQQDHLKITQYKYERDQDDFFDAAVSENQGNGGANDLKYTRSVQRSGPDNYVRGEYQGGVILPMPKVSDSNGAEWGKSDLNVFELGAASLGATAMDTLSDPLDAFTSMGNTFGLGDQNKKFNKLSEAEQGNILRSDMQRKFSDTALGSPKAMGQAGMGIAATQLGKLAGLDISADEFLARSTGRILNPNAELLFQGPVLRDFGFKFLMIARSQREAEVIRKIIKFFKEGAAPVYDGGAALLSTPNVFQLEYKAGDTLLNTVNKFNEMALRTITVDYAPDGFWSAYQDSHPVAVVMSLQFSELRPLYSSDHEGTSESSVGY